MGPGTKAQDFTWGLQEPEGIVRIFLGSSYIPTIPLLQGGGVLLSSRFLRFMVWGKGLRDKGLGFGPRICGASQLGSSVRG